MSNDVSQNLDIIGQVPGDMLGRGSEDWTRIPGGGIGTVLTSQGPGVIPAWAPGGGAGSSPAMSAVSELAVSGSAHAAKGMFFSPVIALTVSAAIVRFNATAGGSYKVMLVELDGTSLDVVLAESGLLSGFGTETRRELFDFGSGIPLLVGKIYALVHVRTDATDTTASGVWASDTTVQIGPWLAAFGLVFLDDKAPAVSDTFTKQTQNQVFAVNFLYGA